MLLRPVISMQIGKFWSVLIVSCLSVRLMCGLVLVVVWDIRARGTGDLLASEGMRGWPAEQRGSAGWLD
ncbi:hypothetical protein BAW75_25120 [Micromonospora chalcea]|nr:hypothetical protein BAW75_25120 [Micromonospora chalcea]